MSFQAAKSWSKAKLQDLVTIKSFKPATIPTMQTLTVPTTNNFKKLPTKK